VSAIHAVSEITSSLSDTNELLFHKIRLSDFNQNGKFHVNGEVVEVLFMKNLARYLEELPKFR